MDSSESIVSTSSSSANIDEPTKHTMEKEEKFSQSRSHRKKSLKSAGEMEKQKS